MVANALKKFPSESMFILDYIENPAKKLFSLPQF